MFSEHYGLQNLGLLANFNSNNWYLYIYDLDTFLPTYRYNIDVLKDLKFNIPTF